MDIGRSTQIQLLLLRIEGLAFMTGLLLGVVIHIDLLVLNLLMLMTAGHRLVVRHRIVVDSLIILLLLEILLIGLIGLQRLLKRLPRLILVGVLLV